MVSRFRKWHKELRTLYNSRPIQVMLYVCRKDNITYEVLITILLRF